MTGHSTSRLSLCYCLKSPPRYLLHLFRFSVNVIRSGLHATLGKSDINSNVRIRCKSCPQSLRDQHF